MPAVERLRLRAQILTLIGQFDEPASFCSGLKDLLDQYSNRAYRPGQVVKSQPLLPSYRVTPLILREIEVEFNRLGLEKPEQSLKVAEVLWTDSHLEPRLLAATLLGAIPIQLGESVISIVRAWAKPEENFTIIEALFQNSTTTLRRAGASPLLRLAEDWISSSSIQVQALGVRILIPLVHDQAFENLPPVYRLLTSLVQNVPGPVQADLQAIIEELIKRSPTETAFFLRQALPIAQGQATARLIRRCLPSFAPEQQATLKAALAAANLT